MIDKKRRDITLGEMQDECKKHGQHSAEEGVYRRPNCELCDPLIRSVCDNSFCDEDGCLINPELWNLTEPPRFTEAQMAFWKQWIAWGARYAMENKDFPHIIEFMREGGMSVGKVFHYDVLTGISLNKDETLDLSELLGKDGAE